ncbi:hypothetical protein DYB35_005941 [Aphanomyces astaci]|uniref:Uncharacterized protein n=1 Tax=Aphanomyces astaci TaxID=112090 RepID=A0A3R7EA73_APHAT|nr:hypothetical protein DYB35_005941 [Aphanomyces astaci]
MTNLYGGNQKTHLVACQGDLDLFINVETTDRHCYLVGGGHLVEGLQADHRAGALAAGLLAGLLVGVLAVGLQVLLPAALLVEALLVGRQADLQVVLPAEDLFLGVHRVGDLFLAGHRVAVLYQAGRRGVAPFLVVRPVEDLFQAERRAAALFPVGRLVEDLSPVGLRGVVRVREDLQGVGPLLESRQEDHHPAVGQGVVRVLSEVLQGLRKVELSSRPVRV